MSEEQEPKVFHFIASTDALFARFAEINEMDLVEQAEALENIRCKGLTTAKIKAEFHKYNTGFAKIIAEQAKDAAKIDAIKADMLKNFVQVESRGGSVKVGRITYLPPSDGEQSLPFIMLYSYKDFRDAFAHLPDLEEDMPATTWWQRNPDKKIARAATFIESAPGGEVVNGRLNLWWGMGVEPVHAAPGQYHADVQLFLRHLWSLCGGPKTPEFAYLLHWLAWAVQHPTKPIGTAVILKSEPGTGKGLLFSILLGIFGAHGRRFNRRDDIVGRFNHLIEGCALACLEEATWAGSKADAERLKSMITDPSLVVEKKFFGAETIRNITKYISATNADWAVHVDHNDRRMAVIDCPSPTLAQSDFDAIIDRVYGENSESYFGAILTFLKSIDVTGWNAERDRPVNAAYAEQKMASLHGDLLWWRLVIERGQWAVGGSVVMEPPLVQGPRFYSRQGIYGLYCDWHFHTRQGGAPVSAIVFWRTVAKWYPPDDFAGPRLRVEGDKHQSIGLPPDLSDLGKSFGKWLQKAHKAGGKG
jgi:hypothetical protein